MTRERTVERHLASGVRRRGGICWKAMPSVAGIPDRVVLLPNGRTVWIELKSPTGRLRPIQEITHEKMRDLGHEVIVLKSTEEVDQWLQAL